MTLTAVDGLPGSLASFPLNAGWNWFSTNVVSSNMSVGSVLSSLAPTEGDIIKSKTAFAVFDPDTSIGWVGTLASLDNTSGYMIKLTEAGTILQEGSFADPTTTPVPVGNGWNWVSYVPTDVKSVGAALADLDTQGLLNGDEIVKSQTLFAEWNSGWFGSLETMQPGKAYRLFLQDPALPATFNYATSTSAVVAVAAGRLSSSDRSPARAHDWAFDPGVFEHNMTVIATVRGNGPDWTGTDKIVGAFVGGQCRGIIALMPIAGIENDLAFATIHSNKVSGETVTFRAFDTSSETTYSITETMPFAANATSGTLRNPVVLTAAVQADNKIPTAYRLAQNHPNPFNPVTTIRFELPLAGRVVLKIYNVAGQIIRTLVDQDYQAGTHNVIWDGRNSSGGEASSGVYFYQIKAGPFGDVKRMVLLR
jgi:hypothetical protein